MEEKAVIIVERDSGGVSCKIQNADLPTVTAMIVVVAKAAQDYTGVPAAKILSTALLSLVSVETENMKS